MFTSHVFARTHSVVATSVVAAVVKVFGFVNVTTRIPQMPRNLDPDMMPRRWRQKRPAKSTASYRLGGYPACALRA